MLISGVAQFMCAFGSAQARFHYQLSIVIKGGVDKQSVNPYIKKRSRQRPERWGLVLIHMQLSGRFELRIGVLCTNSMSTVVWGVVV